MKQRVSKVKNFRDLGGIVTADGHTVAPGRLLRSGHLHKLTHRGAKRLVERYDLRTVVDMRLESESRYQPDVVPPGVTVHHISPLPEEKRAAIRRDNREAMLAEIIEMPEGAVGYIKRDYVELVTDSFALDGYRRFLQLLLTRPEGSVLWHCSQGKDRAGVAAAIVLMALGVNREEIMRDYMRTYYSYRWINHVYYWGVFFIKRSRTWARSLIQILGAYPDYLQTVFDAIDENYGGTEGFLTTAMKLTPADIATLRDAYLI